MFFMANIWQWLLLIGLLGFAVYCMFVIKNEKKTFIEDSYLITFGSLQIPIPNWWTLTQINDNEIHFHRSDTYYNWLAKFQYKNETEPLELTEHLENKLDAEKIEFDPSVTIGTDPRHIIQDQSIAVQFPETIRIEGSATKDGNERVFLDWVFLRKENENSYFLFESNSSVLNGSLEGPFFEEALFQMQN